MPNHQADQVLEALTPTAHDIAVASETIVAALTAFGRAMPTSMLLEPVTQRLTSESLPPAARNIEGVKQDDLLRVRAQAAMTTALAHMAARGVVLPVGGITSAPLNWSITYDFRGYATGYRVADGPFNYQIADAYALPRFGSLAPSIETPALFLDHLPAAMGPKVRRVLEEAVESYRAGQFVACAILLGVASEAAWHHVAVAVRARTSDRKLTEMLDDELTSAAKVQQRVIEVVRPLKLISEGELNTIDAVEQAYRDLRNYAVHRPDEAFDERRFHRDIVGTLLDGAPGYFTRLYELDAAVSA